MSTSWFILTTSPPLSPSSSSSDGRRDLPIHGRWTGVLAEQFPVFHAIGLGAPNPNANGILDLHHFAIKMCRNVGDDAGLWSRARKTTLMGMELLAPSMTDIGANNACPFSLV